MKSHLWIARITCPLILIFTLQAQTQTATTHPVTTTGGTINIVPKYSGSTSIVNSNIFENAGKVGIGTTAPSATLTVQGEIQSTSGGFKFPNGTVQTTAGLTSVIHNITLAGGGTSASPLRIAVPLTLTWNSNSTLLTLNAGSSGDALDINEEIGFVNFTANGMQSEAFGAGAGVTAGGDDGADGLDAMATATSAPAFGVNALSYFGDGVAGYTGGGSGAYGVYGNGSNIQGLPPTYAGWFDGDVHVNGKLSKSGGSFTIDHPLDPANKYLSHSFVESPDMMNIYNGNVITDRAGNASVTLPDWFETLNRDFRYQLTVVGQFAQAIIASEVRNNQFIIKTDKPSVKVSWQVTGIRQDVWANANRIPVEEDKPEKERDSYLHPELYNQPPEKSVEWARHPDLMRKHEAQLQAAKTAAESRHR